MAERREDLSIPDGISPDQDFVQILDPATGTGTSSWRPSISSTKRLSPSGRHRGTARRSRRALERIRAQAPPATSARLRAADGRRTLSPTSRSASSSTRPATASAATSGRECISPTRWNRRKIIHKVLSISRSRRWAHEAQAVSEVKRAGRFTVVIGNPPYSGHSANKGEWIANLIDDYKEGFPELRKPAQAKWLSDDYVKFIRFAQSWLSAQAQGRSGSSPITAFWTILHFVACVRVSSRTSQNCSPGSAWQLKEERKSAEWREGRECL